MNQLSIDFIHTRHRRTDPDTSKDAARAAVSTKRQAQRNVIYMELRLYGPATGKEIAARLADTAFPMTFTEVSRAISEVAGIHRTGARRDCSAEWAISEGCYFMDAGDRDRLALAGREA
jgi:hypothetical protein